MKKVLRTTGSEKKFFPENYLTKDFKRDYIYSSWVLFLECGHCTISSSNSPEHRNGFFRVILGVLFIFMDWSQTHYIFQETFSMERTFFPPIGLHESYSHNLCAFLAAGSLVADDNSSDSHGLSYLGHVFDAD